MKRFLLGLLFALGLCGCVQAANPSFSSFATNHFITNNFLIRSRLNPLQFDTNASTVTITNAGGGGTTNYFNTIYVTNLYATNFYFSTNVFATNTYFTNIYVDNIYVTTNITVGGTNVATLGDLLWTNIGGVLQPVTHSGGTNQFTIAEVTGWTGTGTNAFLDDGTFGGIAVLNPTDGYVPYRFNAYSFEDSPLYRVDASTVAVIHDSTNSIELIGGNVGEIWLHGPVGSPSIIKSDTELYYDLEGNGSRFRMGNLLFTPLTTSQASLGAAATPWQWAYTDSVGWGGHTASFDSAGGVNPEGVVMADPGSIWRNTIAGSVWRKATGVGNTGWIEFSSTAINPTDNYIPFRTNATTFLNSPWYVTSTNASIDSQIIFGPGTTNVLYRSDSNLIYTNGATTGNGVNFQVINGNGVRAMFGVDQDSQPFVRSDSGKVFRVEPNNGGPVYTFSSTAFYPSGLSDLGTSATNFQWSSLYLSNQIVWGPGTTNVLYRNSSDLVYTNGSSTVALQLKQGSGHVGIFAVGASGGIQLKSESGQTADLGDVAGNMVRVSGNSFVPANASMASGSSSTPWGALYSQTNYIEGFRSSTNYSRLAMLHSGTNGVPTFDSQSNGTAGNPRPHTFALGSTNQFSIGDGWIQLMRGITKAEKATITPTNGMVVYQTDNTPGFRGYVNGSWVIFSTAADP